MKMYVMWRFHSCFCTCEFTDRNSCIPELCGSVSLAWTVFSPSEDYSSCGVTTELSVAICCICVMDYSSSWQCSFCPKSHKTTSYLEGICYPATFYAPLVRSGKRKCTDAVREEVLSILTSNMILAIGLGEGRIFKNRINVIPFY